MTLYDAIKSGCTIFARSILVKYPQAVHQVLPGSEATTYLHLAATRPDPDAALLLIEFGAKVDACDSRGQTALHVAVNSGNWEVVDALIEKGADINARDAFKYTPLDELRIHVAVLQKRFVDLQSKGAKTKEELEQEAAA